MELRLPFGDSDLPKIDASKRVFVVGDPDRSGR
jgi:hypothetical protein